MIRKILIAISGLLAVICTAVTIVRTQWDYNENGVYFDGISTYDSGAIAAYGMFAGFFYVVTISLIWTLILDNRDRRS
jgi:hypothetical protein